MRPSTFLPVFIRRPRSLVVGPRPRHGRVLVECCVSMMLLAGAGTLVLLVTSSTAHLVDESRQRDLAQRSATVHLSRVLSAPCLVGGGVTRESNRPRTMLDIVSVGRTPVHTITVDAWWQTAAFANRHWRHHATTVSGWCE